MDKVDVGSLVKTTTNRGGGGPAKGEKPEVNTDCLKMDGTVGKLGSSMALKSKYKLAAVADPDQGKDRA